MQQIRITPRIHALPLLCRRSAAQRSLGEGLGKGGSSSTALPARHAAHPRDDSQPGHHPAPPRGARGCGTGPGVFLCRANPVLASRTSSCTSPPSGAAPRTAATSPLLRASAPAFSASSQRSVAQLSGTSGDRRRESRARYASARPPWGSAAGLRPEPRGQRGAGSGERLVQPAPAAAATLGGLGTPKTAPPLPSSAMQLPPRPRSSLGAATCSHSQGRGWGPPLCHPGRRAHLPGTHPGSSLQAAPT